MRILVTGGAGFIASHVADAFCEAGHEVLVLDNLSSGKRENVPPQAQFIEADITNKESIQQIVFDFKPEIIDHHAAHIQVGNSVKHPDFDAQNNILGLINIMEAAKEVKPKKILFASTGGAMYGTQPVPFTEDLREGPLSPYGVSKRSGELYLNYYHEQYGVPYTILRYANVYGPRQNPHGESGVVAIFMEMLSQGKVPRINGDGTHTRDYVYVADVVKANLLAMDSEFVGFLNIGTAVATSTNQVFELVAKAMGHQAEAEHAPERPGEQIESVLSYQKAKQIMGWEPTVDFATGVAMVAAWYREQTA